MYLIRLIRVLAIEKRKKIGRKKDLRSKKQEKEEK